MADVLIFAEHRDGAGQVARPVLQLITGGRQLADGGKVTALLIASEREPLVEQLLGCGADAVLSVDDARLTKYSTLAFTKIVAAAVQQTGASILIGPTTTMTRDLFGRVAARLNAAVAADCTSAELRDGRIVVQHPVYTAKAMVEVELADDRLVRPTRCLSS
jgi:electron transfer flavoprotein alpha subunit